MGRHHRIDSEYPSIIMWNLQGFSSTTARTQQAAEPRTRAGGLRCIQCRTMDMYSSHGSLSTTAQTRQPRTSTGRPSLHRASVNCHVELARFLVEYGADVTARDKYGSTPLHQASVKGNVNLIRFLVDQGADANAQDEDGETSLHWASVNGHANLAWSLVEHGADVSPGQAWVDSAALGVGQWSHRTRRVPPTAYHESITESPWQKDIDLAPRFRD